jgi:hypothetical protein
MQKSKQQGSTKERIGWLDIQSNLKGAAAAKDKQANKR